MLAFSMAAILSCNFNTSSESLLALLGLYCFLLLSYVGGADCT